MKLLWSSLFLCLALGCVLHDKSPITTQVVTYPEGAVVEFNGRQLGRAPTEVVLPQDTNGRLTEKAVLRAVPNSAQPMLIAQTRVLDPGDHTDRVPNRILIDLTLSNASALVPTNLNGGTYVEKGSTNSRPIRRRPVDRGKPTQPVGIDRWNPGVY
jgi:hypothetical protein